MVHFLPGTSTISCILFLAFSVRQRFSVDFCHLGGRFDEIINSHRITLLLRKISKDLNIVEYAQP